LSTQFATLARIDAPPAPGVSTAPFVRIENVSKQFRVRRTWGELLSAPFRYTYAQALRGVTLDVNEGEFFGLLGQNGAGKTTLFKILATLVIPDSGIAMVGGADSVRDVNRVRRQLVPVVADERSLRWRLNALENMKLYAALYRVPRAETKARIQELLEVVDLADTGNRMVGQFSSGMRQRLLIARALLGRPRALLLDEPTRGLDPLSARSLRTFLKDEICRRQGCTVLLATHNAEEAFYLCDRVGILDKGRVLTTGPARALAEQFTDDRYRVTTRAGSQDHAALRRLLTTRMIPDPPATIEEIDGWITLEMRVPGGAAAAARALETLVGGGLPVARFERVQLSLAELIERVQRRSRETEHA
jgi:ABC-2 type transport system ATP-binding protein